MNFAYLQSFVLHHKIYFAAAATGLYALLIILVATRYLKAFFQKKHQPRSAKKATTVITSQDIRAIAGEDVMATQLDLARAYMELGKKQLVRSVLKHVLKEGNTEQKREAKQLLAQL